MDTRELTPKQQTSEALRSAESILIVTGQHPSVDQVASTLALTAILRKLGKKVTAVISDEVPAGAGFLDSSGLDKDLGGLRDFIVRLNLERAQVDKLKYTIEDGYLNLNITPFQGGFTSNDVTFGYGDYHFDVVIALGVPSYSRLDRIYAQNSELLRQVPLLVIDYHRSNEQYGAVNHIDNGAATLSELMVALSESLQAGLIDDNIATMLLTGIMAATDRFTAASTTPKALTVAAQMMAMGAQQTAVVKGLYRSKSDNNRDNRQQQPAQPKAVAAEPIPAPAPQSAPVPVQAPQPQSAPEPVVVPEPTPEPVAEPTPVPQPAPESAPQPEPTPEVAPQPAQQPYRPAQLRYTPQANPRQSQPSAAQRLHATDPAINPTNRANLLQTR